MTEQQLQQALNEASGFLERQRLLKQLWKLCRQREAEAAANGRPKRVVPCIPKRVAPTQAESMVA